MVVPAGQSHTVDIPTPEPVPTLHIGIDGVITELILLLDCAVEIDDSTEVDGTDSEIIALREGTEEKDGVLREDTEEKDGTSEKDGADPEIIVLEEGTEEKDCALEKDGADPEIIVLREGTEEKDGASEKDDVSERNGAEDIYIYYI
jgi:hypothetical protein